MANSGPDTNQSQLTVWWFLSLTLVEFLCLLIDFSLRLANTRI
jgi:hypothetical protein